MRVYHEFWQHDNLHKKHTIKPAIPSRTKQAFYRAIVVPKECFGLIILIHYSAFSAAKAM